MKYRRQEGRRVEPEPHRYHRDVEEEEDHVEYEEEATNRVSSLEVPGY